MMYTSGKLVWNQFNHTIVIKLWQVGSSGTPKGVRIGRQALFNRILWQYKAFPFQSGDVCVLKTSLTFGDSIAEVIVAEGFFMN